MNKYQELLKTVIENNLSKGINEQVCLTLKETQEIYNYITELEKSRDWLGKDYEEKEGEIWKDIKGYEGRYKVSNFGRIKSYSRDKKGSLLSLGGYKGYLKIKLKKNGLPKTFRVHRLVAESFLENKNNAPTVNHIDGNKANNYADNLEWATHQEQSDHALKNNLIKNRGESCPRSRLTEIQVLEIRELYRNKSMYFREMAKLYNISISSIKDIINGVGWKHITGGVSIRDEDKHKIPYSKRLK